MQTAAADHPPRVRLWYPADPHSRPGSALRRACLRMRQCLPGGGANAATPDRPLARDQPVFPLIVYHPGWPGTDMDNFRLIAELASHGYVIASRLYRDRTPMTFRSEADCERTVQMAEHRVRDRARDTALLLDRLMHPATRAGSEHLAERLDPGRIGIMGFSFGGAIAAETSTLDARFRAVVNIDGRHWGAALEQGVACPYLYLGAPAALPAAEDFAAIDPDRRCNAQLEHRDQTALIRNLRRHGGMRVTVAGASHLNFADCALRASIRRRPGTGLIDPKRALQILNAYVIAFFGQALRREPSPLLHPEARPFAEAHFEVWP